MCGRAERGAVGVILPTAGVDLGCSWLSNSDGTAKRPAVAGQGATVFLTVTVRSDNGQALGVLVLKEHAFSSGKAGWFGQGKVTIDGERYQCQAQVVKIGPAGEGVRDAKESSAAV